jgi:hypothetical protein
MIASYEKVVRGRFRTLSFIIAVNAGDGNEMHYLLVLDLDRSRLVT